MNKEKYSEESKLLHNRIKELNERISKLSLKSANKIAYIKIADIEITKSSYYIALNQISLQHLEVKSNDDIRSAMKCITKALFYYEEVVTNLINVQYNEYKDGVELVSKIPYKTRKSLMTKLGFSIDNVLSNIKYNTLHWWGFVELKARYSVIIKNMLDLKKASSTDPRDRDYRETLWHVKLVKEKLNEAANGYIEKYQLSTKRLDDIKAAINLLESLIMILNLLGDRKEIDQHRKKREAWIRMMNRDFTSNISS